MFVNDSFVNYSYLLEQTLLEHLQCTSARCGDKSSNKTVFTLHCLVSVKVTQEEL